ncbi:MAG: glucose 1-dehydrogenase [Hyphomicrobiaceae bacterium]|nr:glucose 1-dehydrogenase [Hyphomicrobiaceae bacterium]
MTKDLVISLSDRRTLITGASKGLGAHFAHVLAASGADVAVAARDLKACESVCDSIRSRGGKAVAVAMDVSSSDSVSSAVERAATALGGLDILINNAGITQTIPLIDQDEAAWDRIFDTNLKGGFLVAQAAARAMRDQGNGGNIVNVASILGHRIAGQVAAYAASKAALVQLTKSMALEWARFSIRVNALCPGYIETDLNRDFLESDVGQALTKRIPQRRFGTLADLEGPLLFLCSDAARYMTGTSLVVDGGHLVSSL